MLCRFELQSTFVQRTKWVLRCCSRYNHLFHRFWSKHTQVPWHCIERVPELCGQIHFQVSVRNSSKLSKMATGKHLNRCTNVRHADYSYINVGIPTPFRKRSSHTTMHCETAKYLSWDHSCKPRFLFFLYLRMPCHNARCLFAPAIQLSVCTGWIICRAEGGLVVSVERTDSKACRLTVGFRRAQEIERWRFRYTGECGAYISKSLIQTT